MKAKQVNEELNFKRGQSVKSALNVGMFTSKDLEEELVAIFKETIKLLWEKVGVKWGEEGNVDELNYYCKEHGIYLEFGRSYGVSYIATDFKLYSKTVRSNGPWSGGGSWAELRVALLGDKLLSSGKYASGDEIARFTISFEN